MKSEDIFDNIKTNLRFSIVYCIFAAIMNSSISTPSLVSAPTSDGSVSLGVVIGAAVGGVMFILVALWFRFKILKSYTGTLCVQCFKYQVDSEQPYYFNIMIYATAYPWFVKSSAMIQIS